MSKSKEWEQFSAYRGLIEDAKHEARKEIIHDRKAIAEYARKKLIDQIKAIRDRENQTNGDYDYYYGVDALLEELGEE
jgi:hypothetical protein